MNTSHMHYIRVVPGYYLGYIFDGVAESVLTVLVYIRQCTGTLLLLNLNSCINIQSSTKITARRRLVRQYWRHEAGKTTAVAAACFDVWSQFGKECMTQAFIFLLQLSTDNKDYLACDARYIRYRHAYKWSCRVTPDRPARLHLDMYHNKNAGRSRRRSCRVKKHRAGRPKSQNK